MKIPEWKTPEWLKPGIWGAVIGVFVIAIVAFSAGWVVWSGSAEEMAAKRAETAVLAALTPVCVAQFKSTAKASTVTNGDDRTAQTRPEAAMLAALEKTDSWKRGDFVEKKGWATMPGSAKPNEDVAQACANELMKLAEKSGEK